MQSPKTPVSVAKASSAHNARQTATQIPPAARQLRHAFRQAAQPILVTLPSIIRDRDQLTETRPGKVGSTYLHPKPNQALGRAPPLDKQCRDRGQDSPFQKLRCCWAGPTHNNDARR